MPGAIKTAAFVAQSVAIGLALAFVVVLVRPDLINPSQGGAGDAPSSYANAVVASAPAVANIYTAGIPGQRSGFAGIRTSPLAGEGLGSGVVISRDGYLVTNWHVIRDADEIYVRLSDGRAVEPTFVGADPETELALLKIDLPDLPTIALGRSDTLRIGDVVLAIGNSLGLSQTVTQGIVSATGRGLEQRLATFESFIQTDAAINVGNSGGALVNTRGELVGINTAVLGATLRDEVIPAGVGFAIPVNLVRGVMAELIEHGRVIRGWLGVNVRYLPTLQAQALGLSGPGIELLEASGPAASAGLRRGDVVTHVNGDRMLSAQQMMNLVAGGDPGETVRIRGIRHGAGQFETEAVLEERPPASRSTG
ncbi:MAG TPA: trypsin-like peptidase domain-containing protein [Gammaproteobacteria bacterium]|nr:trypsin-like peptidase domain-containing protein [Gammaproteobacteria bacterium]